MSSINYQNYEVFDDGRVFSNFRHKFLKGEIVQGYIQYSLYVDKKIQRIKAHRLVALLFLENKDNLSCVNHKDGNKLNNSVTNLEWCTYKYNNYHARENKLNDVSKSNSERWNDNTFRQRTSKNISSGLLLSQNNKGKNNSRFRYNILHNNREINRKELASIINKSQSYTDTLIKAAASGVHVKLFKSNNIIVIDTKAKSTDHRKDSI